MNDKLYDLLGLDKDKVKIVAIDNEELYFRFIVERNDLCYGIDIPGEFIPEDIRATL